MAFCLVYSAMSLKVLHSGTTEQTGKESQVTKVNVSPEEAKRRLEVLRKRPELQKLHMSLVGGGLISDAQFWNGVWFRLNESEQRWLNNGSYSCSVVSSLIFGLSIRTRFSQTEERNFFGNTFRDKSSGRERENSEISFNSRHYS